MGGGIGVGPTESPELSELTEDMEGAEVTGSDELVTRLRSAGDAGILQFCTKTER